MRNLEKGIKPTEDHADQDGIPLSPPPSTLRSKQIASKRSENSQGLREQPNPRGKQPSQSSSGQRRKHKTECRLQQALSPISYSEPRAQSNGVKKRKQIPDNNHSESIFPKRARLSRQSRGHQGNIEKQSQGAEHGFKSVPNSLPRQLSLPPASGNKPQAQRGGSRKRKQKLSDDEDNRSIEEGLPKKVRLNQGSKEQLEYQEPQVASQVYEKAARRLLGSHLASDTGLGSALETPSEQLQRQQSIHSLGEQGTEKAPRNPIAQWVDTGFWPNTSAKISSPMENDNQGNDASVTGPSPSEVTGADTAGSKRKSGISLNLETEEDLAYHGVFSTDSPELEPTSRDFCAKLLEGAEKPSAFPCYPEEAVPIVLENFRDENEMKLQMVIMPWVIPSAENLALQGLIDSGKFTDQYDREWRCTVFGNSKPKPDYAVGVANSIFTRTMYTNLKNYGTYDTPFQITPNLRFPFLMGEAKTVFNGLGNADRQNIHSAALAIRAIIKLYEAAFGPTSKEVEDLFCKILVFTISHDSNRADIYGHFATRNPPATEQTKKLRLTSIDEKSEDQNGTGAAQKDRVVPVMEGTKKIYYYRHLIGSYDFRLDGGAQRFKPYNFVFNVYKIFGPKHIERILKATTALKVSSRLKPKGPRSAIPVSELTPNDSVSAAPNKTALELQAQLEKMTTLLEQQQADSRAQLEKMTTLLEQQRADSMAQLEQQRADSRAQLEQLRADSREQEDKLRKQIDKLLDKISS